MLKYILMGLMTLMFSGCFGMGPDTIVQTKVVYVDKKILITPPEHLLKPTEVPVPPDKQTFIHTDNVTRMNMLSNYATSLLKALGTSNDKIKAIKDWSSSLDKVYNEKKPKVDKEHK